MSCNGDENCELVKLGLPEMALEYQKDAHIAWNALVDIEILLRGSTTDDDPIYSIVKKAIKDILNE